MTNLAILSRPLEDTYLERALADISEKGYDFYLQGVKNRLEILKLSLIDEVKNKNCIEIYNKYLNDNDLLIILKNISRDCDSASRKKTLFYENYCDVVSKILNI
jgi:hypothetical protein